MIDKYKEYTDKLKKLKSEIRSTVAEYAHKVRENLDEEFSKYLQPEDFEKITGFPTPHHELIYYGSNYRQHNAGVQNGKTKIYLFDDTYGIDFYASSDNYDEITVYVYTWHTINNVKGRKFICNNNPALYYPNREPDYQKFVKKYIERMKKNIIERDFRKVKRDAKKYNL